MRVHMGTSLPAFPVVTSGVFGRVCSGFGDERTGSPIVVMFRVPRIYALTKTHNTFTDTIDSFLSRIMRVHMGTSLPAFLVAFIPDSGTNKLGRRSWSRSAFRVSMAESSVEILSWEI
uniref:Uncharacterized protein n=1 Tax=Daucus carota subsp. sativus TaxID=79200 RepID=A0A175YFN7_DAUCS